MATVIDLTLSDDEDMAPCAGPSRPGAAVQHAASTQHAAPAGQITSNLGMQMPTKGTGTAAAAAAATAHPTSSQAQSLPRPHQPSSCQQQHPQSRAIPPPHAPTAVKKSIWELMEEDDDGDDLDLGFMRNSAVSLSGNQGQAGRHGTVGSGSQALGAWSSSLGLAPAGPVSTRPVPLRHQGAAHPATAPSGQAPAGFTQGGSRLGPTASNHLLQQQQGGGASSPGISAAHSGMRGSPHRPNHTQSHSSQQQAEEEEGYQGQEQEQEGALLTQRSPHDGWPMQPRNHRPVDGQGGPAGTGRGGERAPLPDVAQMEAEASAQADEAADRARAQGLSDRDVARERKAAYTRSLREIKARDKERAKEQAKADKEAMKVAKAKQKEADKHVKQVERQINRALSGGGSDPVKHMLVLLSPRLMEVPWGPALLVSLQNAKIEYKSMGPEHALCSEYACVRWVRRVPRQAAALVAGTQQQEGEGEEAEQGWGSQQTRPSASLQPIHIPGLPDDGHVCLALPLVMVFLTPQQLVAALPPAEPVPGAPFCITYKTGPGGGGIEGAGGNRGGSRSVALARLREDMQRAYPGCTLTVACVGLDRELAAMERAHASAFNANVVRNLLLDLQLTFPAIRLREDLSDGGMACELMVKTTACLAAHHKKQQGDGYLDSHRESNVSRGHPGLAGASAGQRALAVALGHLLPPARAVAVATQHTSLAALIRRLTDPARGVREREEALMSQGHGPNRRAATTVGKTSSKAVHDFLTQENASATCRPERS